MEANLPEFSRISADSVKTRFQEYSTYLEELLKSVESASDNDAIMSALSDMNRQDLKIWGPLRHISGVREDDSFRKEYETYQKKLIPYFLKLGQSKALYQKLNKMVSSEKNLPVWKKRLLEKEILSMKHSGVGLDEKMSKKFHEITEELTNLSMAFKNNVMDDIKSRKFLVLDKETMRGVPENVRSMTFSNFKQLYKEFKETENMDISSATEEEGPWVFTLEMPIYRPTLMYCQDRKFREKLYRAYMSLASSGKCNNKPVIEKILQLRDEKAKLLGYRDYAELSLNTKMAKSFANVQKMYKSLIPTIKKNALAEFQELQSLATELDAIKDINHWDMPYYGEKLKEKKLNLSEEELRPYFQFNKVLQGLFDLCEDLFEIVIAEREGVDTWDEQVRYFEITDRSKNHIGSFYVDPYVRSKNKRPGAWVNICQLKGKYEDKSENPVTYVILNTSPPTDTKPSLMSFSEVTTLFHEFGHALQSLLTTVENPMQSGIAGIEWDAVEIASQFMENWCFDKEILKSLSSHYKTGEPLSDALCEKVRKSETFRKSSLLASQIVYGLTDMELHTKHPESKKDIFEIQKEVFNSIQPLPIIDDSRFICSFSHIFAGGYACGYYSYLWSENISQDVFLEFKKVLHDKDKLKQVSKKYRDTFLALGGSEDPELVFEAFAGRSPDPQAILSSYDLI